MTAQQQESCPGNCVAGFSSRTGGASPQRTFQLFNTGATGPGINYYDSSTMLNGAFDPRTGWPFVLLDHFVPRSERTANLWIVQTRDCPQELGSDPWPCLKVMRFGSQGCLVECGADELLAQVVGRPVLIQIQGNLTTPDVALGGLLWTHSWLDHHQALPPDVVMIAFDWPSQRIYPTESRDVNAKAPRAEIAGYHLARFVQGFPASSRVCLLGHSYGGRVVVSALHLLGGGSVQGRSAKHPVQLDERSPDLHVRAVAIEGSGDHHWLNPGEKFGHTLQGCEAFLNLHNRCDRVLLLYPLQVDSEHRRSFGQVGLLPRDLARLGPLADRFAQHDLHELLGTEHTLLNAVAHPQIARWIAPYIWASEVGQPARRSPIFQ